jgi:hypothetical protein
VLPRETKLGRLRFSVPRPYEIHAPRLGWVWSIRPEIMKLVAGPWLGFEPWTARRTQRSSTHPRRCGRSSLTSIPLSPHFWNSNGDGRRPPVTRSVRRATPSGRWPAFFAIAGLGSSMSRCDGPPAIRRKITRLALGAKWGSAMSAPMTPSEQRKLARPSPPTPEASELRKPRLDGKDGELSVGITGNLGSECQSTNMNSLLMSRACARTAQASRDSGPPSDSTRRSARPISSPLGSRSKAFR